MTPEKQMAPAARVRVVIVDDSSTVRGFLSRWFAESDDIEVVGAAANGLEAVSLIPTVKPDVVVLDIEMPHMNGLEALPLIKVGAPGAAIIVSSRLTRRNAELALRCLEAGASEIIPKPSTDENSAPLNEFRRDLTEKVRALGRNRGPRLLRPLPVRGPVEAPVPRETPRAPLAPAKRAKPSPRPMMDAPPRAIVVGASTGGPTACAEFIAALKPLIATTPVVIAQHMPAVFTRVFAEHLQSSTGAICHEAKHGDALKPGRVFIAPGGFHLTIVGAAAQAHLAVDDRPPVRFSRPSVDLLFESARDVFGGQAAAVILTGMGADGLEGARALAAAGARIYAQNEESSVVWGMPGAVARAGLAHDLAPPAEIAAALLALGAPS